MLRYAITVEVELAESVPSMTRTDVVREIVDKARDVASETLQQYAVTKYNGHVASSGFTRVSTIVEE